MSKYRFGFCKWFDAQQGLVSLIKKWKEGVDNAGAFDALMTDFYKAFDCLHNELLIAWRLWFHIKSVKIIQ